MLLVTLLNSNATIQEICKKNDVSEVVDVVCTSFPKRREEMMGYLISNKDGDANQAYKSLLKLNDYKFNPDSLLKVLYVSSGKIKSLNSELTKIIISRVTLLAGPSVAWWTFENYLTKNYPSVSSEAIVNLFLEYSPLMIEFVNSEFCNLNDSVRLLFVEKSNGNN